MDQELPSPLPESPSLPLSAVTQSLPLPFYKRLWRKSQTVTLAAGQAITGGLLMVASQLNTAVNSSELTTAMGRLTLPSWVPWVLLAIAGLTYLAHGHGEPEHGDY